MSEAADIHRAVTKGFIRQLNDIGDGLHVSPCLRAVRGESRCGDAEDARLKKLVGTSHATYLLLRDPERMCDECAALEHVQRAAQRLRSSI